MDRVLRGLYRRFLSTGATDDGSAFLQAAIRASYPIETERFDHEILRALHNTLVDGKNFLLGGVSFNDLLRQVWMPLISGRSQQERPIYATWCRAYEKPNGEDVKYQVSVYTISRNHRDCLYCHTVGPHLCEEFVHPDADGLTIPYRSIEDMNPNDENSRDPIIKRTWFPTQETRQMETVYTYAITRFVFVHPEPTENPENYPASHGWSLIGVSPVRQFIDEISPAELAGALKTTATRSVPRGFRTVCLDFYNDTSSVPSQDPHEPLEKPPVVLTGPCEDFIKIPGGRVLQEIDYATGRVRIIADTTTICGHGYTEAGHLCPPTWSDTGEQAGWRCNICRKLLGLQGGREGYTVRCEWCNREPEREEQAAFEDEYEEDYKEDYEDEPDYDEDE